MEDELSEEFRQSIEEFPVKQLPEIYRLLEKYSEGRSVKIFKSRQEADSYLEEMSDSAQKQRQLAQ